ncbi:MAG: hypothetical protein GW839_13940 [Flavobacteriales bacterium]|nr:hypothetical protein [Flavobacteriales bacterium]NCP90944.1 hypothetical protein [Flavobacteriales bacterium]NCQ15130.1 hypothetical protein [Flavobacteriales bacterium]NCQ56494.1 hypothetical protein [Flavobacteriales bacterium]PIQ18832.1 MAG: hypothetical protein COW66_04320 [Flavobacteriaceae bacterium CG18_big_fil_WC_8_21_14_2_50_34_36]
MKTIDKIFKILLIILISTTFINAQNQFYRIHVDHVYPSNSDAYEKISKRLADLAKENKEEKGWNVLWTNDNRVISIEPISGWQELSDDFMPNTRAKLGDEKFGEIFEEFDKHYDNHNDYIITLSNSLSYMPDGMTTTPEGKNYRKNIVMYHKARDRKKIAEIAQKYKDLYTKKGSKSHYRFYFSGFGNEESYILVSSAAVSPLEYAKQAEENRKLLGEDADKLWNELSQFVTKLEYTEGNMMPELSYSPAKK